MCCLAEENDSVCPPESDSDEDADLALLEDESDSAHWARDYRRPSWSDNLVQDGINQPKTPEPQSHATGSIAKAGPKFSYTATDDHADHDALDDDTAFRSGDLARHGGLSPRTDLRTPSSSHAQVPAADGLTLGSAGENSSAGQREPRHEAPAEVRLNSAIDLFFSDPGDQDQAMDDFQLQLLEEAMLKSLDYSRTGEIWLPSGKAPPK
jgi:hypothetical protein